MAEERSTPRDRGTGKDDAAAEAQPSFFKRLFNPKQLFSKKCLATALILSLLGHVAYLAIDLTEKPKAKNGSREVTLGEFYFANPTKAADEIQRVDFRLHVDLLEGTDKVVRERLERRKSMVQQNVEQLLRRARAVDFTDPVLTELKRQLQETINETISLRGISDVIITDLAIERQEGQPTKEKVASHKPAPRSQSDSQAQPSS